MVIVRLMGGLGNQLFEYAAGRALALRTGQSLAFDSTYLTNAPEHETPRKLRLAAFGLDAPIADEGDIKRLIGPGQARALVPAVAGRILRRIGRAVFPKEKVIFSDTAIEDLEALTRIKGDAYLNGFWQTEAAFADHAGTIRAEFASPNASREARGEMRTRMRTRDSVSIHIRRGDYVTDADTNAYHGTCSVEYYQAACSMMSEKLAGASFFVFSDDMDWCRENLDLGYPVEFVESRGPDSDVEEIRLMSSCAHNIIANSSFSWWGAWLNANPQKTVIAPRKWFNHSDPLDACRTPRDWIRI